MSNQPSTMSQPDAFRLLVAQGKTRGQAVRAIARRAYGPNTADARDFMAGWRDSNKYADGLEDHERGRSGAYSDGWTLAANV